MRPILPSLKLERSKRVDAPGSFFQSDGGSGKRREMMNTVRAYFGIAVLAVGLVGFSQPAVAGAVKGAAKGAVVGHVLGHHAKAGAAVGPSTGITKPRWLPRNIES